MPTSVLTLRAAPDLVERINAVRDALSAESPVPVSRSDAHRQLLLAGLDAWEQERRSVWQRLFGR